MMNHQENFHSNPSWLNKEEMTQAWPATANSAFSSSPRSILSSDSRKNGEDDGVSFPQAYFGDSDIDDDDDDFYSDVIFRTSTKIKKMDDTDSSKESSSLFPSLSVSNKTSDPSRIVFVVRNKVTDRVSTSYQTLRITYLVVTLVVMLADGLQGTHLYVLYEGYGFSVATLYGLGFVAGGLLSPVTGPWVDQMGRKRAALLYCGLEMLINQMEQYPVFLGLIASRVIGGFTTNLLSTVFETWLDTEARKRGIDHDRYEVILRDAAIVRNTAAIGSGYLAHWLAESYGPVGPFRGAVTCTMIAFGVVALLWNENYGYEDATADDDSLTDSSTSTAPNSFPLQQQQQQQQQEEQQFPKKSVLGFLKEAIVAFRNDSRMLRVGLIQGISAGTVLIFVFLWTPTLRMFAQHANGNSIGLDKNHEPAYGLIFGAYMAAGVVGSAFMPLIRRVLQNVINGYGSSGTTFEGFEILAALCYFFSALLLMVPGVVAPTSSMSFTICLVAFIMYEVLIGVFLPCEGVIRALYFPVNGRASILALPSIIINVAVSVGVVSTHYISLQKAFVGVGFLMLVAAGLQLSLISKEEWLSLQVGVGFKRALVNSSNCRSKECRMAIIEESPPRPALLRLSVSESSTISTFPSIDSTNPFSCSIHDQ